MDILKQLKEYFNVKLIGSYLFVEANLLSINDINDVDIALDESLKKNVEIYLKDKGFSMKLGMKRHEYGNATKDKMRIIFSKKNEFNIDIVLQEDFSKFRVYSLSELVASKFKRGTKSDFIQLQKIIKNKLT